MFFFFLFTVKPFAHLNALKRGAWERTEKAPTNWLQTVCGSFLLPVECSNYLPLLSTSYSCC